MSRPKKTTCTRCLGLKTEPEAEWDEMSTEPGNSGFHHVISFSLANDAPPCRRCNGEGVA